MECQAYGTGERKDICAENCTTFQTEIVDKINENVEDESIKICRVLDNDGCKIIFQYSYSKLGDLIVKAEKEKICVPPVDVLG